MQNMAALSTHNLTIGYGQAVVQQNLCLEAHEGNMICLLGQNGCGKSTLIRTLANLQPALGGTCHIGADNLLQMTEHERAKRMAVVLTERLSADRTTVHDAVAMGRYPYSSFLGGLSEQDEDCIRHALEQTEMAHKTDCYFNELSDGEKQRTLIAKALAQQTPFILLDEPTAHLDLPNRIKTLLLLRRLAHETKRTVLISTHELDLALQTADIIWLMTPRKGVEVGTPRELTASGAFQRAFEDPHFRFEADSEGRLSIRMTDAR